MIALYLSAGTFSIPDMMTRAVSFAFQFWIFLAFGIAFAIKVPMAPFHTWLPAAHVEAPTAGSVLLASVLLKMGTYGFVRFCLPITPQATLSLPPSPLDVHHLHHLRRLCGPGAKRHEEMIAYSSVPTWGL